MTEDIFYLDLDDLIRLHARIFTVIPAALESALARPVSHATYEGADIAAQAAILAHGIAQSQSFLDGNKRTALIAMTAFLALNGWDVDVSDPRLAQLILDFAAGASLDALADELRTGLQPNNVRDP